MGEKQKFDANTKRVVASNLTVAYYIALETQTRNPSPTGIDRQAIINEIKRSYWDLLNLVEDIDDHLGV
jgi:hypothetical protein